MGIFRVRPFIIVSWPEEVSPPIFKNGGEKAWRTINSHYRTLVIYFPRKRVYEMGPVPIASKSDCHAAAMAPGINKKIFSVLLAFCYTPHGGTRCTTV